MLAFNVSALPRELEQLAQSLSADEAVGGLRELYRKVGAPTSLMSLGLVRGQLDEAVDAVAEKLPIDNPRPVHRSDLVTILTAAFEGTHQP